MKTCFSCKKELDMEGKPARGDTCPHCTADLKACLHCVFHDEDAYNQCREPQAERVVDKDRSNFCDFFRFRESKGVVGDGEAEQEQQDPMQKLKDLFKD